MAVISLGDMDGDSSSWTEERMGTASAASWESRPQWLGTSMAIIAIRIKHTAERQLRK